MSPRYVDYLISLLDSSNNQIQGHVSNANARCIFATRFLSIRDYSPLLNNVIITHLLTTIRASMDFSFSDENIRHTCWSRSPLLDVTMRRAASAPTSRRSAGAIACDALHKRRFSQCRISRRAKKSFALISRIVAKQLCLRGVTYHEDTSGASVDFRQPLKLSRVELEFFSASCIRVCVCSWFVFSLTSLTANELRKVRASNRSVT